MASDTWPAGESLPRASVPGKSVMEHICARLPPNLQGTFPHTFGGGREDELPGRRIACILMLSVNEKCRHQAINRQGLGDAEEAQARASVKFEPVRQRTSATL
jgi:hypothetical protein